MSQAPIAILKTGTATHIVSHRGDFEDWIGEALAPARIRTCLVNEGEPLPAFHDVAGAVVTGSVAMVTARLDWSERCAEWLRAAVDRELPILGICFGHQLLAHALGGRVGADPAGREIGTKDIVLTAEAANDPLLAELASTFSAHTTHLESVLELPPRAVWLARSAHTPYHAFRWGPSAWGVQFHPEFDAEVMAIYLRAKADELTAEGADVARLLHGVAETPHAYSLLRRFAALL